MINLPLTVISDTAAGLVLGWTPPPGAEWYTLYTEGVRVSNHAPVDKNGVVYQQVKFAPGKNQHQVVCNVLVEGVFDLAVGTWDRPTVPPVNPPIFKGDMETVSPPYSPFQSPQAKNYANPTDSAHSSFGYWFRDTNRANTGVASARVDLPGTGTAPYERAQTITTSPQVEGKTVVWSAAFLFPPNMFGAQCMISEPWYQALPAPASSPGLSLYWVAGKGVEFVIATGACAAQPPVFEYNSQTGAGGIARQWAQGGGTQQPIADVWHQFIMRIHLARDKTGTIECWHRIKGVALWDKTVDLANLATLQYVKATGSIGGSSVTNMIGCYRARTPPPGKPISMWYDDFCRFATLEDALGYFG